MAHDLGKENLTPGIDWYAGFTVLLLLLMLPGCKHDDRYAYQQIKEAYDQPKKLPAALSEPAVNQPGKTPENVLKAAGALTLQTVIQIALQNNPVFFSATSMIGMIALPFFPAMRGHLSSDSLPPHFLRWWLSRWFILHYRKTDNPKRLCEWPFS
ncbi:MAG: hypothetical protein LJE96_22820 [Deltaproteobacteria bacterium]|nr:hypothetical protein [Deltaproteobacteria bacterium]